MHRSLTPSGPLPQLSLQYIKKNVNAGATGTADHVTLLRLLHLSSLHSSLRNFVFPRLKLTPVTSSSQMAADRVWTFWLTSSPTRETSFSVQRLTTGGSKTTFRHPDKSLIQNMTPFSKGVLRGVSITSPSVSRRFVMNLIGLVEGLECSLRG